MGDERILVPAGVFTTSSAFNVTTTAADGDILISEDSIYVDPANWRFFGLVLGLFVVVLGTVGNGLTVWAYARNRNLQTSFNVLIANLCCVELVFSAIIIPLQLPGYILQKSPYPDGVCSAIGYFYYSSLAASLQNLVAIAINRYVGIVNTKRYQRLFTGARLRICVISIWLTAPILYLPIVIGGLITFRRNSMRCAITSSTGSSAIRLYNLTLNIIYQAGGLILLIVLYYAIIKKVNEVQKKLKTHKLQSSFTSTSQKKDGKQKAKMKIKVHTPHTTSGDETPDEYRPSSLVSGGFQFRPVKDDKNQDWKSGSDHDLASHRKISEHSNSRASFITASEEPSPKPKKRMSLWQVLFRNKAAEEEAEMHMDKTPEITADNPSPATPTNDTLEARTDGVALRKMSSEIRETRRKKSLSAPTLPSLEEIIQQSRKNSAAVAQNIPDRVKEANESDFDQESPGLHRAFTVGSKYKKNLRPSMRISGHNPDGGSSPTHVEMLPAANFSDKLVVNHKTFHTSMPTLFPSTNDTPTHTRLGTIARKIRDHKKSKRTRGQRSRQREKALRRRHARERQLVYSSFAICIAFAICILPTSLLHVAQVLFKFKVHAGIVLFIGCISWLHAIVNPFIYGYMNHIYRKEYSHIAKELEQKISACFK